MPKHPRTTRSCLLGLRQDSKNIKDPFGTSRGQGCQVFQMGCIHPSLVDICLRWRGSRSCLDDCRKPSRCQDVPGLISKTIQDAFILLLHDWPVRVITDMYNTTHMGTTHTLYISNLDWEMYTNIVHYRKIIQTILQG